MFARSFRACSVDGTVEKRTHVEVSSEIVRAKLELQIADCRQKLHLMEMDDQKAYLATLEAELSECVA